MKRTLSVKELRQIYCVGPATIHDWIRNGELKAICVNRRPGCKKIRWRVTEAALAAFEALRTHNPPPPRTHKRNSSEINFY